MDLKTTIQQLPSTPGIYQYFDKNGRLLYVGKAKSLSNRVKSYWYFTPELRPNPTLSVRITKMLEQTVSLEYIVVNSEHDALILENSLIKQLHPKYNILLRDDKTYPYIYLDNSEKYPRLDITRKIINSKDITYFGPYSVGARDILNSIYSIAKLVQKKGCLRSKKLCLYYQIDKCLGPCELPISKERYQQEVDLAVSLIKNKKLLIKKLQEKMEFYAEELRFEEAAELRDTIDKISRSEINSEIDFASNENFDIFVVEHNEQRAVLVKIFMRNGKIISSSHDYINLTEGFDANEIFTQALVDFYKEEKPPIVAPILVNVSFEDQELIEEHLSRVFEKKASITIPQRGKKKDLISLAHLNAQELLKKQNNSNLKLLQDIKELCQLEVIPNRVEIFDNSHMAGMATVGAMVVYEDGKFDKKSYRTYHLEAKDEYAQMRETLTRRVESFSKNPAPDLWILDGGATLLNLALDILVSNGVNMDVIAISKEKIDAKAHRAKGKAKDIIYTKDEIFKLKDSDKRLQWVQNLRDEAHRSAITFHKKTKLKLDQESKLLSLQGISAAKVQKLLNHFGSFENIRNASTEELSTILNRKDAKNIKIFYN
ncbi:excinuclease ABC subunit UvrC [Sulfurimonas sp. C5]|uniref:excinuclease ABC subunit UvrC n=1 Tax=Sulfurimonas sp. C5 TaxID=3036947 RepID=UPI002457EAE7|nr:excinuclease ABC subunit UvrC [Sulfurimonas sp. C5]MDH4944571.1 excinuclease ABC subunit UvrC [Sulfurimonas sp. C5]